MLAKKLKRKIVALISVFFLSASLSMAALDQNGGGSAESSTGNSSDTNINVGAFAYVLTILGITETEQMSFGAFTPGTGGTITTSGNVGGAVTKIPDVPDIDNAQEATITMTGNANTAFNLRINGGSSGVTLVHTNGSTTMPVSIDTITLDQNRTFDGSGNDSINIGGTLTVADNQLAGLYSGTYNVEIKYIE